MATNDIEIDPVLVALGPLGAFACIQCFFFFLGFLADAYQLFSYVFTGQNVEHLCAAFPLPDNGSLVPEVNSEWLNSTTVLYEECSISVIFNVSGDVSAKEYPCMHGIQYETRKDASFVSEFDLVCAHKPLAGLTQTLLSFGAGIGCIVFPWLSDLYGRKRMFMIATALVLVLNIVAGFAPTYTVLAVLKFFLGLVEAGISLTSVTAGVEMFPSSHRAISSGFFSTLWWALCIASLAPLAYLLRNYSWRTLQLTLSAAPGLVLVFAFFLREPVRWLVANGKIEEAEEVLRQAARWNRKNPQDILRLFHSLSLHDAGPSEPLVNGEKITPALNEQSVSAVNGEKIIPTLNKPSVSVIREDPYAASATREEEEEKKERSYNITDKGQHDGQTHTHWAGSLELLEEKLSFLDLLRHKLLRKHALLSCFIWFVNSLVYNTLYLMSGTLALSLYTSFFLYAMVEGASCILMIIMLTRVGRKPTLGLFHLTAGLGLIVSSLCFHFKDVSGLYMTGTVFSLLGMMGIGGSFNGIYLYTPEIFPTNIRNRALGVAAASATLGGMASPFSNLLADYAIWAPGAVFGGICGLALLCLLALPESKDKELPQTTHDLEMWYTDVTSARCKDVTSASYKGVTSACKNIDTAIEMKSK